MILAKEEVSLLGDMVVVELTIPATLIFNAVCLLLRAVNDVRRENSEFQSNLDDLQTTLANLKSTLDQIESANHKLAFRNPKNVVKSFVDRLEKGKELVSYCSKFHPINFVGRYFHNKDLLKLKEELIKFHQSEMLAEVLRDNKLILAGVQSLHHKVDRLLVPLTSIASTFSRWNCREMLIVIGLVVGGLSVVGVISPSEYAAMEIPGRSSKLVELEICSGGEKMGKCLLLSNQKMQRYLMKLEAKLSESEKDTEQKKELKGIFLELQALLSDYEEREKMFEEFTLFNLWMKGIDKRVRLIITICNSLKPIILAFLKVLGSLVSEAFSVSEHIQLFIFTVLEHIGLFIFTVLEDAVLFTFSVLKYVVLFVVAIAIIVID